MSKGQQRARQDKRLVNKNIERIRRKLPDYEGLIRERERKRERSEAERGREGEVR